MVKHGPWKIGPDLAIRCGTGIGPRPETTFQARDAKRRTVIGDALAYSIHGYDAKGASPVPRCISHRRCAIVNRTQGLVLGFFLTVLGSLVVIRAAAPEVYDQALRLPPDWLRWMATAFLLALAAFIVLLSVGVLRRWRWIFWLILLAFLAGVLRVPVAILQLTGVLSASVPAWYVVFQGLIGVAQLAIGLAMLAGYRRAGVWGAF